MPRELSSVRLDEDADAKYVLFIEGLSDAYTNDATGALVGSGLGTWIGDCETAIGGNEILGSRRVLPGLIVPDSVSFRLDIKSGTLQPSPATFQILDVEDTLATLFATEGQASNILGEHIPAGTSALGSSVQTVDGAGTVDPRGRWIGLEKIGPNGERRQWPAIPFDLVGYDHPVHAGAEPPAGLPPVLISSVPLEFAGRPCALYRIYADPTHPSGPEDYAAWYTLDEAFAAGDLVWWGVLRDAGQVSGNGVWALDCHGPDKLLAKTLNTRSTSQWMRVSAELTLATEESYVAIGFLQRGLEPESYDASIFEHQITATDRASAATELDGWIEDAMDGTSTNWSGTAGTFDAAEITSTGFDLDPDAGVTQDGKFFVRRRQADFGDPQINHGIMYVAQHSRAWRNLGWEPKSQKQKNGPYEDAARVKFYPLKAGENFHVPYTIDTNIVVPGEGYWVAEFTTIALGYGLDDTGQYDNDGFPREWWPKHTSEVFVVDRHGGQVLRVHDSDPTTLYLEQQTTAGTTTAGSIDGDATDRARWFAMRGPIVREAEEDDPETEEVELGDEEQLHQVFAGEWIQGASYGVVSEGDSVGAALYVSRFLDPRPFGFQNKPLTDDWSGKVTGKGAIEIVPLATYHYFLNEKPVEQADTLLAQIMLSTGSCTGYDEALDDGGEITAGANTHPLAVDFAGDYEIADLGLGIPYQLVQHPTELRRAFTTLPGSWDGDLNRLRLAYIGPFQSLDVLDSITQPRLLCWSLAGKQYGLFRLEPIAPSDADMAITEDDLYGEQGKPETTIPAQNLRATGQIDGNKLEYRWNPAESTTELSFKTRALDAGASRRTGELVEEVTDHGLLALEWFDAESPNPTGVQSWRAHWRQLWQHDAPEFFAKRHFSVTLTVGRHKGQDLMPGSSVLLSNPWPVSPSGGYGLTGYTGRVISATHNLRDDSTEVELLIFANQATLHYAPVARVSAVSGSTITFYEDWLGHGDDNALDGTGFVEPDWSSIGGATQCDLYQRSGETWTLVESDTVTAVDLDARTLTIAGTFSTWLRDRDHIIVLRSYANQTASTWTRSTYLVTADTDLTVGDGSTQTQPFIG